MLAMAGKGKRGRARGPEMAAPELARVYSKVAGMELSRVALMVAELSSSSERAGIAAAPGIGIKEKARACEAPIELALLRMLEAETAFDPENPELAGALAQSGRDAGAAAAWMESRLDALSGGGE